MFNENNWIVGVKKMIDSGLLIAVFFVLFFAFLFLGVPITFSLGASGTVTLLLGGKQLTILTKSMFAPFESYTLLAVFLFTLMGAIFEKTGMASLLVDALMPIVGRFRGGLALTTTYASALFGALTGSSNATCATFSKLMGKEMVDKGYPRPWTAAMIASAAQLGQLIPPSMTCVILGVVTGTSIGTLFMVDLAIGIMTLAILTVFILVVAKRRNLGGVAQNYARSEVIGRVLKALPIASVPLIVMGGMYGGIFTPTEAGAIGSLISLILALFYRKLNARRFYQIIVDSAATTSMVMLLIAASYVVSYIMSFTGITQWLVQFLVNLSSSGVYVGLLFLIVLLLIMGCFIDLIVLCILLAPTAVTALQPLGLNPYHINAIFLVANLVGLITPPVGVSLFISTYTLEEKIERVSKEIIPFVILYIIITLIVCFSPDSIFWLPRLLGIKI